MTRDERPLLADDVRLLAAHGQAARVLEWQLRHVTSDLLPREVPSCPGWDLRALVNHVVGGAERYAMLMEGATPEEVEATRSRDHVAGGVVPLQRRLDRRLGTAFVQCPPTKLLRHRAGPVDRAELLRMRVLECLVHAWDVSVTVGVVPRLDEGLCDEVLVECRGTLARLTEAGFYRPLPPGSSDTAAGRLLMAAGRRHSR
jgi:uncharacterized protein (TIGR03086 family)